MLVCILHKLHPDCLVFPDTHSLLNGNAIPVLDPELPHEIVLDFLLGGLRVGSADLNEPSLWDFLSAVGILVAVRHPVKMAVLVFGDQLIDLL